MIPLLVSRRDFSDIDQALNPALSPSSFKRRARLIEQYLTQGGLPGICFIRDERLRTDKIREQLATLLDRDLRLVYPSTLTLLEIESFVRALALQEGMPVHHQHLRRSSGITPITQKKILQALEAIYLVRFIALEGDRQGIVPIFEDQGEANFLQRGTLSGSHQLLHLVYRNIRAQYTYRSGTQETYFQFRTRGGVVVPLALRTAEGELGFIACEGDAPTRREIAAAQSFIRRYGRGKCILITPGARQVRAVEQRIATFPPEALV